MIIHQIVLGNFSVYSGIQTLDLYETGDSRGRPITLIGGLNGAGKTSLLEAVLLALYGRNSPSVRLYDGSYSAYLLGLIHRQSEPTTESFVELAMEVPGDTRERTTTVRIRRSWRIANVRAVERVTVWRGSDEDPFLAEGWDSYVEELVPSGLASLFFFDGEKIGALAESEETPEDVQLAIKTMLGLDLIDRLIRDLSAVVRRNRRKLGSDDASKRINAIEDEHEALFHKKTGIEHEIANREVAIRRYEEELGRLKREYLRFGGALAESRTALETEDEHLESLLLAKRSDLVALAAGTIPLLMLRESLDKIHQRAMDEEESRRADIALPVVQELMGDLESMLRSSEGGAGVLTDQIFRLVRDKQARLECKARSARVFSLTPVGLARLQDLHGTLPEVASTAREALREYKQLKVRKEQTERHLTAEIDEQQLATYLEEITGKVALIERLRGEQRSLQQQLASTERRLQKLQSEMHSLSEAMVELDEASRIIRFAVRSQETMKAFRERVTHQRVGRLAESVTTSFRRLIRKSGLAHHVRIEPDSLRITLEDADGEVVPKSRLSSGEKQMLAVAILWGLAQASGRRVPVIIDTPLARLDSSHRMNYVQEYLPQASHQVIILSTDTEIVDEYLRVVEKYLSRTYLLSYNEESRATAIDKGYFQSVKESAYAGQTS